MHSFIIDLLSNKFQFSFKFFFNLLNKLSKINFIYLNLVIFVFIYDRTINLFKFNIDNENNFKKYYSNYDLLIDNKDIMNYGKIDIKGLNKIKNNLDNIDELIEDDNLDIILFI